MDSMRYGYILQKLMLNKLKASNNFFVAVIQTIRKFSFNSAVILAVHNPDQVSFSTPTKAHLLQIYANFELWQFKERKCAHALTLTTNDIMNNQSQAAII